METAMKLASMTDTNVFMLVEHSGGRYFSGKRHLCDSYINHRLSPIGNDVEMEINPDVSAIQERPNPGFYQPEPSPSRSARSTLPTRDHGAARKRSSNEQQTITTSPAKRHRTFDGENSHDEQPPLTTDLNNLKREAASEGFRVQPFDGGIGNDPVAYESSFSIDQSSFVDNEQVPA